MRCIQVGNAFDTEWVTGEKDAEGTSFVLDHDNAVMAGYGTLITENVITPPIGESSTVERGIAKFLQILNFV